MGMTEDELHKNIGQIASGSKPLSRTPRKDLKMSNVIGQFGVGFYSAFMVAKDVDVIAPGVKEKVDKPRLWQSTGLGEYSIKDASEDEMSRGMS